MILARQIKVTIFALALSLSVSLYCYGSDLPLKRYILTINPELNMGGRNVYPHQVRFVASTACLSDNLDHHRVEQLNGFPHEGSNGRFIGYHVTVNEPCRGVIQVKNSKNPKARYVTKGSFHASYNELSVKLCGHNQMFKWQDILQSKKINNIVSMSVTMNLAAKRCF